MHRRTPWEDMHNETFLLTVADVLLSDPNVWEASELTMVTAHISIFRAFLPVPLRMPPSESALNASW